MFLYDFFFHCSHLSFTRYNTLYRLLLDVRRVQAELQAVWKLLVCRNTFIFRYEQRFYDKKTITKDIKVSYVINLLQMKSKDTQGADRAAMMPLWSTRNHMSFVVDNILHYLQVNIDIDTIN